MNSLSILAVVLTEERFFFFFGFLAALIVLTLLITTLIKSRILDESEKGKDPLLAFRAGMRIGSMNWTFPFVRFALYDDFIVLSSFRIVIIPLSRIQKVMLKKGSFSEGVKIVYHEKESQISVSLIIWVDNAEEFLQSLNRQTGKTMAQINT